MHWSSCLIGGVICMQAFLFAAAAGAAVKIKATLTDPTLGTMPYNVLLPNSYTATGSKVPLVLFLHGAGERGTDNNNQLSAHPTTLIAETQTGSHQAVMIAPQCPNGATWAGINEGDRFAIGAYNNAVAPANATNQLQLAMKILDFVQTKYNVDTSRVYITGLSMGGYGTWEAVARWPERFAAAVPLSGGGNTDAAPTLKDKPIWAYHGQYDPIVPATGSSLMVGAIAQQNGNHLNEDGGTLIYTPTVDGHGGWSNFYTPQNFRTDGLASSESNAHRQDLYDWMFSKSLAVPEPTVLGLAAVGFMLLKRRST